MRFPRILLVFIAGLSPWILQVQGSTQQDFEPEIVKAENFYNQGQYTEALALLTPLDDMLTRSNRSVASQSRVKMLIGLNEIALSETEKARTRFVQYCALNPDYVLDELQYPRKVVTVFKEAQQECVKCVQVCNRAESIAASGDAKAIADVKSETEYCACASRSFARDEAALAPGRELMSQGKYGDAVRDFKKALTAVPQSAARRDALQTAQSRVDSTVAAAIKDWRQLFFSRQWERAAATYDQIRSLGNDSSRPLQDEMRQIAAQYQTTFEDLLSSWSTACSSNNRVALNTYREWAKALDPNSTIEPDAMKRMGECASSPQPKGTTK